MTISPDTRADERSVSPTVTVDFDLVETTTYRGTVEIDPTAFLAATGIELHRATGAEIRDYALDADVDHEERRPKVQDVEWSNPVVEGMPSERNWYDLRVLHQHEDRTRVLVDPVRYEQTMGKPLIHQPWDTAGLKRYILEHPEQIEIASTSSREVLRGIHGIRREG